MMGTGVFHFKHDNYNLLITAILCLSTVHKNGIKLSNEINWLQHWLNTQEEEENSICEINN